MPIYPSLALVAAVAVVALELLVLRALLDLDLIEWLDSPGVQQPAENFGAVGKDGLWFRFAVGDALSGSGRGGYRDQRQRQQPGRASPGHSFSSPASRQTSRRASATSAVVSGSSRGA